MRRVAYFIISICFGLFLFCNDDNPVVEETTATLSSIKVTPATATVAKETTEELTVTGTYSDGSEKDLTDEVTWQSSDTSIATVDEGVVTTIYPGEATITATLGDFSDDASLTVTGTTVQSISVLPNNDNHPLNIPLQFTAMVTWSDSSTEDLTEDVSWSSSNRTVAAVSDDLGSKGLASADSAGVTQIRATFHDVTGTTNLTVNTSTLVSISITPSNPAVAATSSVQLAAIGTFSNASTVDLTDYATWSSTNSAVATVGDTDGTKGLATGVSGGSATIRAQYNSIQDTVTIFVSP